MIESIRVLSHKNCGFINYYTQEEAMRAKRSCHNKEIMGPGTGTVRIGFAKVPPMAAPPSLLSEGGGLVVSQQQQQQQQIFNNLMDENHNKTSPFTPTPTSSGNSAMMMAAMMDDHQLQQQMFYMMEMMNTSGGSSPSPNLMNSTTNNMYSAVANERKLIMQEFGQDDSDGPIFDGKQKKNLNFFFLINLLLQLHQIYYFENSKKKIIGSLTPLLFVYII